MNLCNRKLIAVCLALVFTALYLFSSPPELAPYRDAGEMTSCIKTLGIVHPPGYPLYVLAGRVFSSLVPGNLAYRLNLFSAVCGGACLGVLFYFLAGYCGLIPALSACILLGVNFTFWHVSCVSEMYSLNILLAVILLSLAVNLFMQYERRRFLLLAFLYGVFAGNRMDIILFGPAVMLLCAAAVKKSGAGLFREFSYAAGFFILGMSVYLYLPVRAARNPLLDWNHPSSFAGFWGSITRKSYGGTLDLLSKNYAPGELFITNLKYYGLHIWKNFGLASALILIGLIAGFRRDKTAASAFFTAFFIAGPVFLFLGNMPPNPHALAIVEPHYLLPDICLAVFAACGLFYLSEKFKSCKIKLLSVYAGFFAVIVWTGADNIGRSFERRWNLLARDFALNAMRTCPRSGWLIAKKDVQLFSLWHEQLVEGKRGDIKIIAQGLSGSGWYQKAYARAHPGITLKSHLHAEKPQEWINFLSFNRPCPVFATQDVEIPQGIKTRSCGILLSLGSAQTINKSGEFGLSKLSLKAMSLDCPILKASSEGMGLTHSQSLQGKNGPDCVVGAGVYQWNVYARRGFAYSKDLPDFFSKDIADVYAQALFQTGALMMNIPGAQPEAEKKFLDSLAVNQGQPEPALYLGILASNKQNWKEAAAFFEKSAESYNAMSALSEEYHSLRPLKENIYRASGDSYLNLGVALEKLGRRDEAAKAYGAAVERNPGGPEAHYNMAVLYWNIDWQKAAYELRETLKLNPNHPSAAKYLIQAESRISRQ